MYYLQTRYYDPDIGRFVNCDDVNYIGLTELSWSCNPFAYCENDPMNNCDPIGYLSFRLNWQWSVGFGVFFILLRLLLIKNDIKSIRKNITKDKVETALTTAIVYSKFYISAEIIGYMCKVASAVAVLNTIISLITFAFTGGSSTIASAVLSLAGSYFVPGLAYSIKMIYYGLKKHKGCTLRVRWTGIAISF